MHNAFLSMFTATTKPLAINTYYLTLSDLGNTLYPGYKATFQFHRIKGCKQPVKSIMRGYAVGQLQEGLSHSCFASPYSCISSQSSAPLRQAAIVMNKMSDNLCRLQRSIRGSVKELKKSMGLCIVSGFCKAYYFYPLSKL